jgi:hypothetical protein
MEMAIWRMTDEGPIRLEFTPLDLEARLESLIVNDPSLVGLSVLVVGRQVPTGYGGFVDVVAVDSDGQIHILELKRDRTPREVVAQILDYGSWAQSLSLDAVSEFFAEHQDGAPFDEAFADRFGAPLPDVFNADQHLTIIASELDAASDRIVEYLADRFGVPINAVFFRHFQDGDSEYLARTWLIAPEEAEAKRARSGTKMRPWNGRDYYVVLGRAERNRWPVCSEYGFVGAGGGPVYTKPLQNLALGNRVFAYVPGAGYVGVGEVVGTMSPLRELQVAGGNGAQRVVDQAGVPDWLRHWALDVEEDLQEYAVPVKWLVKREVQDAVWQKGLFASQVTVCKLRDERTLEVLAEEFSLPLDE